MFQDLRYLRSAGLNPNRLLLIGSSVAVSVVLIVTLTVNVPNVRYNTAKSAGPLKLSAASNQLSGAGQNAQVDFTGGAAGLSDLTILGDFQDGEELNEEESQDFDWDSRPVLKASQSDSGQRNNEGGSSDRAEPVVRISGQGRIRGTVLKSRDGNDYFAFYKVPFARPPLGELRFKVPQRPRRWLGVRDGTKPGPQCIQKDKYGTKAVGSEDCLFLNIYTPKIPEGRLRRSRPKLPVMFYLHGGFASGNGTRYGAKYFADEDVILVTMEYRMGLLAGFYVEDDPEYPGNLGRRDMIAALQWVQRNIDKFGGDPERVVIFGNSGGGIAVHLLLMTPMAAGLFSGAIIQSGNAIDKYLAQRDLRPVFNLQARAFGCNSTNAEEVITCLQGVSAADIVLNPLNVAAEALHIERPVSSRRGDSKVFITDTPWNVINSNQGVNQVPLIVGVNSREYSGESVKTLLNENYTNYVNENWSEYFTRMSTIQDSEDHDISDQFYEAYFGNATISNETRLQLMDFESDKSVFPVRLAGLIHANMTGQPVYMYWVAKEAIKSYGKDLHSAFPPPYGASHADELQYIFNYDGFPEISQDSPWYFVSHTMVSMWASFARDGAPKSPTVDWNAIDPADRGMKWFQIDDELKVVEPFTRRMELWDEHADEIFS